MKAKLIGFVAACTVLAAWAVTVQAAPPPLTLWATQIGSSSYDAASGIAVDGSGNSYIAGQTEGHLAGPNQGSFDAFTAACDSGGTVQCTRQIGTSQWDGASDIAVDGSANSYITGFTDGDLGGPNQGDTDAFIAAWDSSGIFQWTRQIGSSEHDSARGIAVDSSGNSYITGYTFGDLGGPNQGSQDVFIVKYDSGGAAQWTRQIGSSSFDDAHGIAVDGSGNSYITGSTSGDLGGPNQGGTDVFITKYNTAGTEQWTCQIGTGEYDAGIGIAVDGSGNSYITGWTEGDLGGPNQGVMDAFIAKCDSGGTVQWTRQIGSSDSDEAHGIALDGSGNSYITGSTSGDFGGPNQGLNDIFVAKYDTGGTVQWKRQIGTTEYDEGYGIAADASGNIYITGGTDGGLGGPNQGSWDAFIVAFGTTLATAGDATLNGCVDGLDYVLWSSNYQTGTWWVQGDFSGDGIVDGLDYIMWSSNYNVGCPAVPAAVPEPTGLLLLALGGLALIRRRRRA